MERQRHKIAILGGTGAQGSGLALRLAAAGHELAIGSRDATRAGRVAAELTQRLGKTHRGERQPRRGRRRADRHSHGPLCCPARHD